MLPDYDDDKINALLQRAGELKAMLERRTPSKADAILGQPDPYALEPSQFFATVAMAQSSRLGGPEAQAAAKATLEDMGVRWAMPDPEAKATVGDTDAAGGYLVPNNVVAQIAIQATPVRGVVDLFTNINGVRGSAVDIPWEQEAVSRALIVAPGATKENANFIVNNYTATLYTMARIFDVGNQLLRQSQGAAEQLVRSKLGRAVGLGEDYYALNGTGTSQPYGLLTALGTTGTYVTTFSSPSDTTLAGSIASAINTAAGDLEDRGAIADGVAMNTKDFFLALRQGSDTAGYWIEPTGMDRSRSLSLWGMPVRHSPQIPTDTLVVGEFQSAQFFRGQGFRVDVSSEAGDRWDRNLTGFRGEVEIGFDARPAVFGGKFQRIVNAHA